MRGLIPRVAVLHRNLQTLELPPYIASLITNESAATLEISSKRLQTLRPFAGTVLFDRSSQRIANDVFAQISPGNVRTND